MKPNKLFKRLLATALLVAVLPQTATAYDFEVDGLCYNFNDDGISVTVTYQNSSSPYYTDLSGDIIIPEEVADNGTTYSVTSIGDRAFRGCSGLTSVTIPNSVTSIGSYAFQNCSGLKGELIFPNSVTSIGNHAFYNCSGLASVTIPNSVTSIGDIAFCNCSGLTSVTLGNSVTSIGTSVFNGCSGLTSVTIPNSVTSIGVAAFRDCSGLTSVTIPNSVTSIGTSVFNGCSGLTSVTIPNSVTSIGEYAFSYCSGIESIIVQSGNSVYDSREGCNAIIKTASNTLIAGCKNTTIPNSVTTIGFNAFTGCNGLTSVTIPNSVTSIGKSAFDGCSGLTSVIWNARTCADFSAAPFSSAETTLNSFSFGDNVEKIPAYLCHQLTGLTSVTIPNSVTTIGNDVFSGCSGLASVTIPNSVTSIGSYAFQNCSGLKGELIFPNSVTAIGNQAFYGCSGLNSLVIGNSVTTIGGYTFSNCSGLTSVTIGNSVTTIGESAFRNCIGLTSVTIPDSVTSIGNDAFAYSDRFSLNRTLTLCAGVENIGDNVFGTYSSSYRNVATLILKEDVVNIKNLGVNPTKIYTYATTPPECNEYTFKNYSATLHVPQRALAAYFDAPYWQNFTNIVGDAVEPTSLTISADTACVKLGDQIILQATLLPSNASNIGIQWTTSDATIATVNNNGVVTALKTGECNIIVTCADLVAYCHLIVEEEQIVITLDKHELTLETGTITTLTPTMTPAPTELMVASSDRSVATARLTNGQVQVLAVKPGVATITVSSVDGNAQPDSCVVTVLRHKGDVNCDGYIDVSDVNAIINMMLGKEPIPEATEMEFVDMNGDEHIDVSDVNAVINIMLGKQ